MSPEIQGILALMTIFAVIGGVFWIRTSVSQGASLTTDKFSDVKEAQERLDRTLRDEMGMGRKEAHEQAQLLRTEVNGSIKIFGEFLSRTFADASTSQNGKLEIFSQQIGDLTALTHRAFAEMSQMINNRLMSIQSDNNQKLDEMRNTVDEKLQSTLEKRLASSFQIVSERLELVHRGLGEMQTLTNGVGDLKKIFTNVKTRGTWGEVQLQGILEQTMTPDQYEANVAVKRGSAERVEFAIKLPGHSGDEREMVYLPIDSKFPMEDYQRLVAAQEACNVEAVAEYGNALETAVLKQARLIRDKYITSTTTTPFAIMFLPTEGLYLEILHRHGLVERVHNECRVTMVGPNNLTAMLGTLRHGFRTLAIQKRSGEIWKHLTTIKKEFSGFSGLLEGVQKKLQTASNEVDKAAAKSRTIEKKLAKFEDTTPAEIASIEEEQPFRLNE
jgi:DNA recombination protein RmuC